MHLGLSQNSGNLNEKVLIAEQLFPYDFKSYQREHLQQLVEHSHVLWQAPTGFGKTIVSLASMLPFLLDEDHPLEKIIFFVRTKTQVFRILEECNKLSDSISTFTEDERLRGKTITSMPLIGKEELCVHEDKFENHQIRNLDCNVIQCPKAKYKFETQEPYEKLKDRLYYENPRKTNDYIRIITNTERFQNHCPYIVLKKLLYESDIIITTHSFFVQSSLLSYLNETHFRDKTKIGIIIDEVHNIKPSRNAELIPRTIQQILDLETDLKSKKFLQDFLKYIRVSDGYIRPFVTEDDFWILEMLQQDYYLLLKTPWKYAVEIKALGNIISFFDSVGDLWFIEKKILDTHDPNTKTVSKVIVRMIPFPQTIFNHFRGVKRVIGMSGTLEPMEIFHKYLALEDKYKLVKVPLDKQHIQHFILTNTRASSKFKNRSINLYRALSIMIRDFHAKNPNHTIVFNTSKKFTRDLSNTFKAIDTRKVYVEGSSAFNQSLLEELRGLKHELVFATMGGVFSEGVEIKHAKTKKSKITLIIITGIPHPPPDLENQLLMKLYTGVYGKKFAKIFLEYLPMYQLIQQAVGRGIRSYESDFCAIIGTDFRIKDMGIWPSAKITTDHKKLLNYLEEFYFDKDKNE